MVGHDGHKKIIFMNPYEHLESEQEIIDKKRYFMIDNKQWLYEHGAVHPMIWINGKYIPGNVYNHIKKTFIKFGNIRVCLDYIQVKTLII